MKRHILFLLLVLFSIGFDARLCAAETEAPQVYVIPVEGMIERGLLYVLRRSIAEAVEHDAKAIILDMDTPGGRVDAAEDIIRLLIDVPDTIQTCTFVNKDALSAGSMIAVATEKIFMAPGSRIGASAIVTITGDIEEGDMKEKHVSALVALGAGAAERWGHDPDLVEAMIRKDREYKIGDRVICPHGELLTLNEREAAEVFDFGEGTNVMRHALLSSGTVTSLDELKAAIGLENAPTKPLRSPARNELPASLRDYPFFFLAEEFCASLLNSRSRDLASSVFLALCSSLSSSGDITSSACPAPRRCSSL